MKRIPITLMAAIAGILLFGCKGEQAPEPAAAALPEVSTGGTPVPAMDAQRRDKSGE